MPVVTTQNRPLIPAGEHVLTLMQVTEVEVDNSYKPGEKVTKWVWEFDSDEKDEDDIPYTHKEWTKTTYGHPKANLTKLLDQLVPGMDQDRAKNLNTDSLVGRKFKGMIRHEKDDKGKDRAALAYIAPLPEGKQSKVKKEEVPF